MEETNIQPEPQKSQEAQEIKEPSKYYREIPQEEKFQCVLAVMAKKKRVKQICAEQNITRQTFKVWKKTAIEGMAKAFLSQGKRGRKPKEYLAEEEDVRESLEEVKKREKKLQMQILLLETERKKAKKELWMARHAITFYEKTTGGEGKKNARMRKVLKEIFSDVPKKPLAQEGA
jgi:transposase-like protein